MVTETPKKEEAPAMPGLRGCNEQQRLLTAQTIKRINWYFLSSVAYNAVLAPTELVWPE
jgi:hypothetical protein